MQQIKVNKKGFTLIELLAVIIILGVLLLITIPSISKYIKDSRMKMYKNNLIKYIDAVRIGVNLDEDDNYKFLSSEYLAVPLSCIELEKGSTTKSPFSEYNINHSFVLVVRKSGKYEYYISALDSSGYGTKIASENNIKIESLNTDDVGKIMVTKVDLGIENNIALGLNNKKVKIATCDALGELKDTRLKTVILNNNKILDSSNLNYEASSNDTAGLYSINTNTQDNKETYFFRGAVDNNYVKFGKDSNGNDLYWRVVRINEDGSVRLISDEIMFSGELFEIHDFEVTEEISTDDTTASQLTNWYKDNLSQYANSFANSGYCYYDSAYYDSDRLYANTDISNRLFGSYFSPQFACNQRIKNEYGFGAQVGLITADEAVYAGVCRGGSDACPSYLYNADNQSGILTMSPLDDNDTSTDVAFAGITSEGLVKVFIENQSGNNVILSNDATGIRPVINLKADLEVISGNGTYGSPYVIKTN